MKDITFFKIFKILFCIFIFMGFLCIRHVSIADAVSDPVDVVEKIIYNTTTGEYTYEYTLTNSGADAIYWWGIFYDTDPYAIFTPADENDAGVYCSDGWRNNALDQMGGFNEADDPIGSGSGYYSTSAIGFSSGNPQEFIYYYDVDDTWYGQEDYDALILGGANPADFVQSLIGGNFGWIGDGANIQTNHGIEQGEQGTYTMKSEEEFAGDKTFFYNTTDYWSGWTADLNTPPTPTDYTDDTFLYLDSEFEETGTTEEYVAPSGGGGTSWGWPTYVHGFLTGFGGFAPQQWYQAPSFAPSFQQQWYQAPSFQHQLFQFQPFQQQWYQPFQQQWFQPFQQQQQWQQWYQPQLWDSQQWQWRQGRW